MNTKPSHTISGEIVQAQLGGLATHPALHDVIAQCDIDMAAVSRGTQPLTADQFASLLERCILATADESMGFMCRPLKPGTFQLMCQSTIHCSHLRRVILRIAQFFNVVNDGIQISLQEQGEEASISIVHRGAKDIDSTYFSGMMFTLLSRYLAWLIDAPLLINRAYLAAADLPWWKDIPAVLACPVYDTQDTPRIVFASDYLSRSVRQNEDTLVEFLTHAPSNLLSRYATTTSLSERVRHYLMQLPDGEVASLQGVSDALTMTPQTLSRRLKREGHQFQQIKDKARKARSIRLLQTPDLTISDIADKLGFAEDSVFYRQFKRWTGMTPNQYREQFVSAKTSATDSH